MMTNEFEKILDECVDRVAHGESLEQCLAAYPEHAKQLEPLLKAMLQTKAVYSFSPSADAKREARQRFYSALDRKQKLAFWDRVLARRWVWATVASVMVVVIVGFIMLNATVFTGDEAPTVTIASPNPDGNFVFLVSDDVNAIADFSSLNVTIDKVRMFNENNSNQWIEFVPEVKVFDLSLLPGEKTQELWRGDIPEGQYTKVVIYVSNVQGTLKATSQVTDIKLPSNKLQISKPFQISTGNISSFTYDLTVVRAGNAKHGKYILKPQIGESGATGVPTQNGSDTGTKTKPTPDNGKDKKSPKKQ